MPETKSMDVSHCVILFLVMQCLNHSVLNVFSLCSLSSLQARMHLWLKIFPHAKYIYIHRDPVEVSEARMNGFWALHRRVSRALNVRSVSANDPPAVRVTAAAATSSLSDTHVLLQPAAC